MALGVIGAHSQRGDLSPAGLPQANFAAVPQTGAVPHAQGRHQPNVSHRSVFRCASVTSNPIVAETDAGRKANATVDVEGLRSRDLVRVLESYEGQFQGRSALEAWLPDFRLHLTNALWDLRSNSASRQFRACPPCAACQPSARLKCHLLWLPLLPKHN